MGTRFISRREFLKSTSAIAACAASPTAFAVSRKRGVIAGAIRWDAWYKQADSSIPPQYNLATRQYYERAPWFCAVNQSYEIRCIGTASSMETEIRAAAAGGLSYWAFDWYPPDSSLRTAWDLYMSSSIRDMINWCAIIGLGDLGSVPFKSEKWRENADHWVEYMQQPHYQKVTVQQHDRPLLYLLWDANQVKWYFDNDLNNVKILIQYMNGRLQQAGIGPAYVVLLDGVEGGKICGAIGADGISNYIAGHKLETRGPYVDLDSQARDYWADLAAAGTAIVPIAQVGWDTRPRQERPVPWEHKEPNPNPTQFYYLPTPSELSSHIQAAVDFIATHESVCPSKALLIYSWDECDEGGGLIPTLGDPRGAYLQAISKILR